MPNALRSEVARLTNVSLEAAFGELNSVQEALTSISAADRLRIAICVAPYCGDQTLVDEFGSELDAIAGNGSYAAILDESAWVNNFSARRISLFEHAIEMAVDPTSTGEAAIIALREAGHSEAAIVAASQVTSFVAYFGRLRRVAELLNVSSAAVAPQLIPYSETSEQKFGHPRQEYPLMDWRGFVIGIPAFSEDVRTDQAKGASDYYSVLRHEEGFLGVRTELYDTIMTGEGQLERAEREFIALATSLETGCEFCATVHGRRHFFLSKDTISSPRLKHLGIAGLESSRERALAGFASAMATSPSSVEAGHLEALKVHGLDDGQILDAAAVSAMFSWANRLMLTLGEGISQN
ncbi:peroxidase-related enzyme [Paeniglutamicibacter kerguelensis]|uniref:Peroxidase-related enzyme n=1 Tax=Paeniglutamicibacter kerguelensis TaxID=254788 RepID=A0ABS4XHG9_9MICC|nr:putative peroxidase-related enzyme [Paeniglutamicibacter kerguelensis]